MTAQTIIESIKRNETEELAKAIAQNADLNLWDEQTGQSLANLVIALENEAITSMLMAYPSFDWTTPDKDLEHQVQKTTDVHEHYQLDRAIAPSGQARLWAQQFLLPEMNQAVYHIPVGLPLKGLHSVAAVQMALRALMNQHDVLRSCFQQTDSGLEIIVDDSLPLPFTHIDIKREDSGFKDFCHSHFNKTFDFKNGPLWRAVLMVHGNDDAYLYFVYHHIILDGDSLDTLAQDFVSNYNHSLNAKELAITSTKDNRFLRSVQQKQKTAEEDKVYWQRNLADYPEFSLPTLDKIRPLIPSYEGKIYRFALTLPAQIKHICAQYNTSLTGLMFAVYNLLLYKTTGQEDIIIGTATSHRASYKAQDTVGYFLDTLPIRTIVKPQQSVAEFIQQTALNRSLAYAHQSLDFPAILSLLRVLPNPSISPLFQCFFVMMEEQVPKSFQMNGLEPFSSLDARGITFDLLDYASSKYDLSLRVDQQGSQLSCSFEYASDCFHEESVAYLADFTQYLFNQVVENTKTKTCESLALAPAIPAYEPLMPSNDASPCLLSKIKHYAKQKPNQKALSDAQMQLTYKQLYSQVLDLTATLHASVSGKEAVIAIVLPRGCQLVVTQLAILALGGTYVPIDPDYPVDRRNTIIEKSLAKLVVCNNPLEMLSVKSLNLAHLLPNKSGEQKELPRRDRTTPAYILFTSGSTGTPKGIAIGYKALMDYLHNCQKVLPVQPDDLWLSITNPCFDISGYEYFGSLYAGASCHIVDAFTVQDGTLLKEEIERVKPSILQATPRTWEKLAGSGWVVPRGFRGLCGGESMLPNVYQYMIQSAGHFYQFYGPTEATIWATYTEVRANIPPNNIGKPLPHMRAYVLDKSAAILPPYVPGELYLCGSALAEGYWQDKAKTDEAFCVKSCLPGVRLYKTGDRVRMLPDGSIEFYARIDTQLKVNGYRIEAAEVEHHIANCPGVRACAVFLVEQEGSTALIACIQSSESTPAAKDELLSQLARQLPAYMIPSDVFFLTELPLNVSGKTDIKRLKKEYEQLGQKHTQTKAVENTAMLTWMIDYLAPIAAKKNKHLDVAKTNFYDLGLDSKHMVQFAQALSGAFGLEVRPTLLYRFPSAYLLSQNLFSANQKMDVITKPVSSVFKEREPVAIVGMACRFPGADDLPSFWNMLIKGQSGLRHYTPAQLRALNIPESTFNQSRYVPVSGRVNGIDLFDAEFFRFTPKEARLTSPAQRLFLETVWHALEDANCAAIDGAKDKIGVFAGCGDNDYLIGGYQDQTAYQAMLGNEKDYFCTQVAYKLNLTGPAINIQTACSSSLTALHYALQSLHHGECSAAVVGGASIIPTEEGGYVATEGFMFSPSGRCAPFSSKADGIIATQGVGAVLLKPLSQAQLDGDKIYALIKGSAVNNDGAIKVGYVAPSSESQARVIRSAIDDAQVTPESITYIEAHGTGTKLGDPIEINGLSKVFSQSQTQSIRIGSVKGNIGHTIAASGVAGLMKTALSLHERVIPASLHAATTNKLIDFMHSPFTVQTETCTWETKRSPRRAGVSSFGIGGTNAHAVLEEAPEGCMSDEARLAHQFRGKDGVVFTGKQTDDSGPLLLVLSAKTPVALEARKAELLAYFEANPTVDFADVLYTLSVGRAHMECRYVVEVSSREEAILALRSGEKGGVFERGRYVLKTRDVAGLRSWYLRDSYYRGLVNFSVGVLEKQSGLRGLLDLVKGGVLSGAQSKAVLFLLVYCAMKRYEDCGLSVDGVNKSELVGLALSVVRGSLSLGQAWSAVQELGDELSEERLLVGEEGIGMEAGASSFRRAILMGYGRGEAIDWGNYWRGSIRNKVRLPLYPFERRHFWKEGVVGAYKKGDLVPGKGDGLLGAGPIFTREGEVLYQQELDVDSVRWSYLQGHQVLSLCVFPGAGYTELVLSAARRLDAAAGIEVVWINYKEPMVLRKGSPRVCQVVLKDNGSKEYAAEVMSFERGSNGGDRVVHAQGVVQLKARGLGHQGHVDVGRLWKGCSELLDVAGIYERLGVDGVHYSEGFRGVERFGLDSQRRKALASVHLGSSMSVEGYSIHPILLDAAFQSLAGLMLLEAEVAEGMTYIPVGHGRVIFYREMSTRGYAQSIKGKVGSGEWLGDVGVYTEEGDLCLMVFGLRLVGVGKAQLQKRLGGVEQERLEYVMDWEEGSLMLGGDGPKHWLVVGGDLGQAEGLERQLRQQGQGEVRRIRGEELGGLVLGKGHGSICVVYLGGFEWRTTEGMDSRIWELIRLAQVLSEQQAMVERFLIIESPSMLGLSGMYRGLGASLSAARPGWQVSVLEVDEVSGRDLGLLVEKEGMLGSNCEVLVRYEGGRRLVGRLNEAGTRLYSSPKEVWFSAHETCMVTGGLGGIGLRVCGWLVSKGVQHLVLLQRSRLAKEPEVVAQWREAKVLVDVESVDVVDKKALEGVFQKIKKQERQLVGVFHLAGVLRDALLEKLTEEDVEAVFAPKVQGAYHLHELSLEERGLRYFVLFSSLVSLIGSPGQLNYAAANGYLDWLSDYRSQQGLPSQRINYGAWSDVGMAAQLSEGQRRLGMGQISSEEGLAVLEKSMQQTQCAVALARVDWASIWRGRRQVGLVQNLMNQPIEPKKDSPSIWVKLQSGNQRTQDVVKNYILELLQEETGRQKDYFITHYLMGFTDMSLGSMSMSTMERTLRDAFGDHIPLEGELLFDNPTPQKLVEFLVPLIDATLQKQSREGTLEKEILLWVNKVRTSKDMLNLVEKAVLEGKIRALQLYAQSKQLDKGKIPAIILAVLSGSTEVAKLIIDNGGSLSQSLSEHPQINALSVAVVTGNLPMTEWLLKQGMQTSVELMALNTSDAIREVLTQDSRESSDEFKKVF
jgi:amino acid adenylation domain-containing protein